MVTARPWNSFTRRILCGLRVILCLGLMFLVIVLAFFLIPASLHYHVTEQFTFTGDGQEARVYLSVLIPKSGPYQWVGEENVFWDGIQHHISYDDVDAVMLSGDKQAGEDSVAMIEYDVKLRQGRVSWEAPLEAFQGLPQDGIESDHYLIREKASELNDRRDFQDLPYRIYSFTSDHLTYSQVQEDCASSSALMSYKIGSCVCAGYARLMVALSRASDIPAQMVIGFLYPDPIVKRYHNTTPQNPGQAHAWVEYYSYGKWMIADPTLGSEIWKRVYFNRNDGRHIAYGELVQLSSVKEEQEYWALKQATISMGDNECFRYTATTNSNKISLIPLITVRKGWDGRWANAIVIWVIAVFLICKFRYRIIPR